MTSVDVQAGAGTTAQAERVVAGPSRPAARPTRGLLETAGWTAGVRNAVWNCPVGPSWARIEPGV